MKKMSKTCLRRHTYIIYSCKIPDYSHLQFPQPHSGLMAMGRLASPEYNWCLHTTTWYYYYNYIITILDGGDVTEPGPTQVGT